MDTPKTKKRERVTPPKAPAPTKPKVEDPLENFDVQKVMSNGSGQIKGLEANQDYFVIVLISWKQIRDLGILGELAVFHYFLFNIGKVALEIKVREHR